MRSEVLSTILTFVNLLFIDAIDSANSNGNEDKNSTRRIFHGHPAAPADFPYLVLLDIKGATGAGAILNDQWVLTAGHVMWQQDCSTIKINPIPWNHERDIRPIECYAQPDYTNLSNAYDIGLLKVAGGLTQVGGAQPIPLPEPNMSFDQGTAAVVAAAGMKEDFNMPDQVLSAEFRVKPWDWCNEKFRAAQCVGIPRCLSGDMPKRILCTQGEGALPPSVCYGDSGSPAVVNGVVAGVVVFGITYKDNCTVGAPSMHTNVVDYLPWIYSHIDPSRDTSGMVVQPENFEPPRG